MTVPVIPSFGQRPSHASVPLGSAALLAVLALLALGAAPVAALAQDAPAQRSVARHPYTGHVAEAAQYFGIPEHWIWAVIRVESNGNVRAVSMAGAIGLMQIMPATWAGLRVRHRLGADPFDPRDNIMAGAAYLREMHDRYGNVTAMLAAYNAGPGRYDEHLSRGRPLPAETRAYLAKLASISGSAGDTQFAAARPPDPFAWRRAALFAVRHGAVSTAPSSASRVAPDAQPERPTDDGVEPAMTDAPALSNDLFVPLSGRPPQMKGSREIWRSPSPPFAGPEGGRADFLKREGRGQDKGRQCATPFCPGRGLDSQGFWALLRNVRGNRTMCGDRRKAAGSRVCGTLRRFEP